MSSQHRFGHVDLCVFASCLLVTSLCCFTRDVLPASARHLALQCSAAPLSSTLPRYFSSRDMIRHRPTYLRLRGGRQEAYNKDVDAGRVVPTGQGLYRAQWSHTKKANQLQISSDGCSAYNPHFMETMDFNVIYEAWSVRADTHYPQKDEKTP